MSSEAFWKKLDVPWTDESLELYLYSKDMAPLPRVLERFLRPPAAVLRPRTQEEVALVVSEAAASGTPVTPRGGGSTVYGGSVALRGVLLDLAGLRGEPELSGEVVKAGAGWTFFELEHWLRERGRALCSYPSSAPAATIGGWLATGGLGYGTLAYGPFPEQVRRCEVVRADGSRGEMEPAVLAGSEGTLAVITSLELRVRKESREEVRLWGARDWEGVAAFLGALGERRPSPFAASFHSRSFNQVLVARDLAPSGLDSWHTVLEVWERPVFAEGAAGAAGEKFGLTLLPGAWAEAEWEERFRALRVKQAGPGLVGGESLLPVERLAGYLAAAEEEFSGWSPLHYGYLVRPGEVLVMTATPVPQESLWVLARVKKILDLMVSFGGRPYGVGLWNAAYATAALTPGGLAAWRQLKKELDPRNLLNPGKLEGAPWFARPFLYRAGMGFLGIFARGGTARARR